MNLIEFVKGVIRKMLPAKNIENVLHIAPMISAPMKDAIELWEAMYMNKSPWITENVRSMGLASMIASEKARTATIEMKLKITGEGEKAEFMRKSAKKIIADIREQLEYGIAFGGFVIKPYVLLGIDGKYIIEFNYTKATNFFPLSFSAEGKVTEAAFVDSIITKETVYNKLEYHKLVGTDLYVYNKAFKQPYNNSDITLSGLNDLGTPIELTEVPAWSSLAPEAHIDNMDTLLFEYWKMPEANTVDLKSPLGASGFSRAIELIKEADKIYSDLLWEFEGSQLAVDVDRTALNPMKDKDGNLKEYLPQLQDRLFRRNLDLGSDEMYNVFSPEIRDVSIINGLNNQLMRIEDACSLSRGTLSVITNSEARTATELKILKQRSFSANQDIQLALQRTLEGVFHIIEKYYDLYEIGTDGKYDVAYSWDDSIIIDKDTERQQDLLEVQAGLMSKLEYRMKWYGETEDQAKLSLSVIDDEKRIAMEMQTKMINDNSNDNDNIPSNKSNAQANNDKRKRANESNETTKNKSDSDN